MMPQMFNFGGPPPAQAAQQEMQKSQLLARLLAQTPQVPEGNQFGGLQSAIMQKGMQNAMQGQRDQRALQNTGAPFAPQPVDINQLKKAQGLNLNRF